MNPTGRTPMKTIKNKPAKSIPRNAQSQDIQSLTEWLLAGDVSIQYQVYRDLLGEERPDLKNRIAEEGWGAAFLVLRRPDGHWGQKFYQPKWISTHYTLLDLCQLGIKHDHPLIRASVELVATREKGTDGGINPAGSARQSDVCINGMFMNYGCYFGVDPGKLQSVIDYLLAQRMSDGGFNCRLNQSGARHSSLHSTLSVLEGITRYRLAGYTYRLSELEEAASTSVEFILRHQLFLSDHTGQVIRPDFLRLSYPGRWRYDILRALDCLRLASIPYDIRMQPAINVLRSKRQKNGTWKLQAHHPGQVHFHMEIAGRPSRWNTLRALRVLAYFKQKD